METTLSASQIIVQTNFGQPASVVSMLPLVESQRSRINQVKLSVGGSGNNPKELSEINIPADLKSINSVPFLLHDNNVTDKNDPIGRVIIFCTDEAVDQLCNAEHLFIDSTFKACAVRGKLFSQLFIIHARVNGIILPMAYAFMRRKTAAAYSYVLSQIFDQRPTKAKFITMDFERAQAIAAAQTFPNATIKGCYFHLIQIIFRRIRKAGLWSRMQDDDFQVAVRMMAAMSNADPNNIGLAFDEYWDYLEDKGFLQDDRFKSVVQYFEKTFVGDKIRRSGVRKNPRYPASMWVNGSFYYKYWHPRTNATMEATNGVLNYEGGSKYKSLYAVMAQLKSHHQLTLIHLSGEKIGKHRSRPKMTKWNEVRSRVYEVIKNGKKNHTDAVLVLKQIAEASMLLVRKQ